MSGYQELLSDYSNYTNYNNMLKEIVLTIKGEYLE